MRHAIINYTAVDGSSISGHSLTIVTGYVFDGHSHLSYSINREAFCEGYISRECDKLCLFHVGDRVRLTPYSHYVWDGSSHVENLVSDKLKHYLSIF